jgi:hypothetical protein
MEEVEEWAQFKISSCEHEICIIHMLGGGKGVEGRNGRKAEKEETDIGGEGGGGGHHSPRQALVGGLVLGEKAWD